MLKVQLFSAEENKMYRFVGFWCLPTPGPAQAKILSIFWLTGFSSVHGADLKCEKGISWMPWRIEAMKDVTLCDKLRGAGSRL